MGVGKTIKLILAINQRTNNRQSSSRRRKGKKFHVTIKNEIIFCEGKSIEFKFFYCSLFCHLICFGDKIFTYIFSFVLKWLWKKKLKLHRQRKFFMNNNEKLNYVSLEEMRKKFVLSWRCLHGMQSLSYVCFCNNLNLCRAVVKRRNCVILDTFMSQIISLSLVSDELSSPSSLQLIHCLVVLVLLMLNHTQKSRQILIFSPPPQFSFPLDAKHESLQCEKFKRISSSNRICAVSQELTNPFLHTFLQSIIFMKSHNGDKSSERWS